ncbi:MAG: hypothetical protein J6P66_07155 [Bacteroidaceae bacterium]|nr:hypothetical protein [Bacteroidaceae bacterium]
MHLRNCLLLTLALSFVRPLAVNAQEKKGDIDFNIGISTPGLYSLADLEYGRYSFFYYDYSNLSDLSKESYNSTLYPSISAELSYKLADAGFLKRLSLVGYMGLHWADYQNISVASDSKDDVETAVKLDLMLGIRYHILNSKYFSMYSQAFLGGEIKNDCEYWDKTGEVVNLGVLGDNDIRWHVTFLGLRVKLGKTNVGLLTELGYGSEYCTSSLFIIPGLRAGVSYRF